MKIIGIVPARYGSKRLLAKPLIEINDKPLIQLTYEAVLNSKLFDDIFIATDSEKIKNTVSSFGAPCIITSKKNKNGTERCAELIRNKQSDFNDNDLIVNIQCDEPFIQKNHLKKIIDSFKQNIKISTIISPIHDAEISDESIVKINITENNFAINFSRQKSNLSDINKNYKHIGIYAYQKKTLLEIASLLPAKRELTEKLEQLRWLEAGYKISCVFISDNILSINTKKDVKKVDQKTI